jgi:hypothetical protein
MKRLANRRLSDGSFDLASVVSIGPGAKAAPSSL